MNTSSTTAQAVEAFINSVARLTLPEELTNRDLFDADDAQLTLTKLIVGARKILADIEGKGRVEPVEPVVLKGQAIVEDFGMDRAVKSSTPCLKVDRNVPNQAGELCLTAILWVEYLRDAQIIRVVAEAARWTKRKVFALDDSEASIALVKAVMTIARGGNGDYLTDADLAGLAPFLQPSNGMCIPRIIP